MNNIVEEKLKMWQGKLQKLHDEYKVIMQKRGEAAAQGDLRENAAYQSLSEDADTWRVRISEIESIIHTIKKGEKS